MSKRKAEQDYSIEDSRDIVARFRQQFMADLRAAAVRDMPPPAAAAAVAAAAGAGQGARARLPNRSAAAKFQKTSENSKIVTSYSQQNQFTAVDLKHLNDRVLEIWQFCRPYYYVNVIQNQILPMYKDSNPNTIRQFLKIQAQHAIQNAVLTSQSAAIAKLPELMQSAVAIRNQVAAIPLPTVDSFGERQPRRGDTGLPLELAQLVGQYGSSRTALPKTNTQIPNELAALIGQYAQTAPVDTTALTATLQANLQVRNARGRRLDPSELVQRSNRADLEKLYKLIEKDKTRKSEWSPEYQHRLNTALRHVRIQFDDRNDEFQQCLTWSDTFQRDPNLLAMYPVQADKSSFWEPTGKILYCGNTAAYYRLILNVLPQNIPYVATFQLFHFENGDTARGKLVVGRQLDLPIRQIIVRVLDRNTVEYDSIHGARVRPMAHLFNRNPEIELLRQSFAPNQFSTIVNWIEWLQPDFGRHFLEFHFVTEPISPVLHDWKSPDASQFFWTKTTLLLLSGFKNFQRYQRIKSKVTRRTVDDEYFTNSVWTVDQIDIVRYPGVPSRKWPDQNAFVIKTSFIPFEEMKFMGSQPWEIERRLLVEYGNEMPSDFDFVSILG